MTPAELHAWQERVFGSGYGTQVKAAASLAVAYSTYRSWLGGGKPIPPFAERLCAYVERFGVIEAAAESAEPAEAATIDQGA